MTKEEYEKALNDLMQEHYRKVEISIQQINEAKQRLNDPNYKAEDDNQEALDLINKLQRQAEEFNKYNFPK